MSSASTTNTTTTSTTTSSSSFCRATTTSSSSSSSPQFVHCESLASDCLGAHFRHDSRTKASAHGGDSSRLVSHWIENWLSNRKQRVVINGTASDWAPVTSEVPQGSVLGPVLFIIYIDDIDVGLNNFISKFADDTKMGNSIITDQERMSLQEDLRKISEWSYRWGMPFNAR